MAQETIVGEGGIVIEGVHHSYGPEADRLTILKGIDLRLLEGQFIALIGPSGCGKTTLLDIMSGLLPHQTGQVRLGGRPPSEGRQDTARMFARDALLPWRTAFSNVDFALSTRTKDRSRFQRVRALLRDVGLEGFEQAYPRQLSQGMRQRVALARTFSLEADYLFLDEPFGALDAQTKLMLQDKLLAFWELRRSTVILVTHDLGEAVALADRVIVMSARPGRVIADVMIDLPRPRSARSLQKERAYHEIYSDLWNRLEEAAAPSIGALGGENGSGIGVNF